MNLAISILDLRYYSKCNVAETLCSVSLFLYVVMRKCSERLFQVAGANCNFARASSCTFSLIPN